MKKTITINYTLNRVLLKVLRGVDYVSRIALETQKSIPVVYRQLDVLVDFGILSKNRIGKKVAYSINWINLSDLISSTIKLDIEKLNEILGLEKKGKKMISELGKLAETLPLHVLDNKKERDKMVYNFFKEKEVMSLFQKYLVNVEKASQKSDEYKNMDFRQNIERFLDIFGMMSPEKMKKLLGADMIKRNKLFLDFCKARYMQKQALDPRSEFI